jgi:hypothetical protein
VTKWLRLSGALVGALMLAGCTSQGANGTQSTASTPSTAPASASGAALAPKVQNPLPASVFAKHPCDSALTATQLMQLMNEVPPPRHTDNAAGPSCGWTKSSTSAVITVGYLTALKDGLSDVYAKKTTDAYQQPLEVGGYPAATYNSTESTPVGDCDVAVGIADNLVFDVGFVVGTDRYGKENPCDAAKTIAEDVLENLKAAAQ